MSIANALTYAHAAPDHRPFIIGSWMKSMRRSPETLWLQDDEYYAWARKHVSRYVESCPVLVALDPEDPDTIIAYLVYSSTVGHFSYVRRDFRQHGIYKRLREYAGITKYSHRSEFWRHPRGGLAWSPWYLA